MNALEEIENTAPGHDEVLPPIGMLKSLSNETRRHLSDAGSFQVVAAGTKIAHQGVDHSTLWVILAGRLRVSCHAHGDFIDLAMLGPGDIVGEMSLLDAQPSSADVTIIDRPARLWSIDGRAFHRFLEADHSRGFAVMKVLASELSARLRKNSDHLLTQAELLRSHFLDIDY